MIYNKYDALQSLKPSTQWSWIGSDYSGLNWLDSSTKPTESEIDNELTRLNNAESMRLLRVERDARLAACDWTQSRDVTLSNDDGWKTLPNHMNYAGNKTVSDIVLDMLK